MMKEGSLLLQTLECTRGGDEPEALGDKAPFGFRECIGLLELEPLDWTSALGPTTFSWTYLPISNPCA